MGDQTPRGVKRIFALACRPALAPRAEFFFCRDYFWARFELVSAKDPSMHQRHGSSRLANAMSLFSAARMSALAVAIGGEADMSLCAAHICF